jgi:hypothetical protein
MYIEKINSFAEAEVRWNDTKPIRGKEVDMRPWVSAIASMNVSLR